MLGSDRGEPRVGSKQQPTVLSDSQGLCIAITCGNISGYLFLSKLEESKKAQGKCVLAGRKWYTPSDVEALAGSARGGGRRPGYEATRQNTVA